MIWVCVISHNQKDDILPMLDVLRKGRFQNILFVLDRCKDGSRELLKREGVSFIEAKNFGHGAGQSREAGFEKIIGELDPEADILFLDGDRVPTEYLTYNLCLKCLSIADIGLTVAEDDIRIRRGRYTTSVPGKFTEHIFPVHDYCYGGQYNLDNDFYTSGILMSNAAIVACAAVQDGFLFEPMLYGEYGYEDSYLGLLCTAFGFRIVWFPKECHLAGLLDGSDMAALHSKRHLDRVLMAQRIIEPILNDLGY